MTEPERHLVNILKSQQQQLGMLDVPFAKHLGISQGYWSLVKREKRGIGRRTAQLVVKRFPELWREVQDAMFPRNDAA